MCGRTCIDLSSLTVLSIVSLVRAEGDGARPIGPRFDHREGRNPLGMTIRRREPGIDDQPRAVLHQGVADEAELRLHAGSLAVEPGLGVGRALVGLIRALLALEVDLEIAPATRGRIIGIPLSLGSEALHRGPRLDESTIDAEVFARQESLHSRLSQNRIEELRRGIALEEPIVLQLVQPSVA